MILQEDPGTSEAVNNHGLWLTRHDHMKDKQEHGWYVTASLQLEKFGELKNQTGEDNVLAWGPTRDSEPTTFPKCLHVPFWSKKSTMKITSYVEWFDQYHAASLMEAKNVNADI